MHGRCGNEKAGEQFSGHCFSLGLQPEKQTEDTPSLSNAPSTSLIASNGMKNWKRMSQRKGRMKKSKKKEGKGSLLYLSTCTRPDLLPAVCELTRKMSSPRIIDFQRVDKARSSLAGTASFFLTFRVDDHEEILGWTDSSFNSGGDSTNKYDITYLFITYITYIVFSVS